MAKKKEDQITFTKSSGNVFEDLELPDPKGLQAKSELMGRIGQIIKRRHLTQAQAARVLGIDQPKISALLNGRISGFSIDRLLRFLAALEQDVDIVVRSTRRRRPGRIAVC